MITLRNVGVAQELGAGEGCEVGNARIGRDGCRRAGGRRADGADQGEDAIVGDQPAGIGDRGFRLVGVVERAKRQRAPVHAAAPVRLLERRLDAEPQVLAQVLRGAAEGRRLSEEDFLVGHPGFIRLRRRGTRKRQADGHEEGRAQTTHPPHPLPRPIVAGRTLPRSLSGRDGAILACARRERADALPLVAPPRRSGKRA